LHRPAWPAECFGDHRRHPDREGDAHLFRPLAGRPDVLVTFVLLQATSHPLVPQDPAFAPELERARACCDLFVTTSDGDYVAELIDNLAS
jgi:hypothetical protein